MKYYWRDMKVGPPVRTPRAVCTQCNQRIDGASCVGDQKGTPSPGDFTICIYCGHLMAFDQTLRMRELTNMEMFEVAGDRRLIAMQQARQEEEDQ